MKRTIGLTLVIAMLFSLCERPNIKDFWLAYNVATGAARYEYAGSSFDDGFLSANTELIKAAIDIYLEHNPR